MKKGRISAIAEKINMERDPNIEIGKSEQIRETGKLIAYFENYEGNMDKVYENIEKDTKKIQKEKMEIVDARNDIEDFGIGEIY